MGFADFRESALGRQLAPVLADPATIGRMEALSRAGRPAVEAIGGEVGKLAPGVDDTTKQHIGRLVRDAMNARGWQVRRKARVARGSPFSWGAVYGRSSGDTKPKPSDAAGRFQRAQEIIAALGIELPTVDEFLAQRRADGGE